MAVFIHSEATHLLHSPAGSHGGVTATLHRVVSVAKIAESGHDVTTYGEEVILWNPGNGKRTSFH